MPQNVDIKSLTDTLLPTVYFSEISIREGKLSKKRTRKQQRNKKDKLNLRERKNSKKKRLKDLSRAPNTMQGLNITLSLTVRDVIEKDALSTWMSNSDFTKFLYIKVIQTTNKRITTALSRGRFGILKQNRYKKHYTVITLPIQKRDFDLKDYTRIHSSDGERIYEIPYETELLIKDSEPSHLTYFAYTYLDIDGLASAYGLDFNRRQNFQGALTQENVVQRSKINTIAYIFYVKETNQVWLGPIHKKGSSWYTGSSRDKFPKHLRREKVSNHKVKDFRQIKKISGNILNLRPALRTYQKYEKPQLNRDQIRTDAPDSYISQGLISPKPSGEVTYLFHVDFRKLVREQSAFGGIIDTSTNPRAIEEIYLLSRITSLRILRRRIEQVAAINKLGTPVQSMIFDASRNIVKTIIDSGDRDGVLKKKTNDNGAIREVDNLSFSDGVRTFTGTDKDILEVTDGVYQYGISLELVDGTVIFLNQLLDKLVLANKNLSLYYQDALSPRYIQEDGKFSPILAKKYRRLKTRPWAVAIATFIDAQSSLTRLPRSPKIMAKILNAMANPVTGTSSGIFALIEMINLLTLQIQGALGNKRQASQTSLNRSRSPAKSTYKVSMLGINKFFKDLHDSNFPRNFGVDFLGTEGKEDIGTKAVLFDDIFQRVQLENEIYWSEPDMNTNAEILKAEKTGQQKLPADTAGILDLQDVEFGYLTPSLFRAGNYEVQRTNMGESVWDSQKYNAMASAIVAVQSGNHTNLTQGPPASKSPRRAKDTRANSLRTKTQDRSNSSILSQIGVMIVEPTEETMSEFSSLDKASATKLLVSARSIFSADDPINSISSTECNSEADTDNEEIQQRKRAKIRQRNKENKRALSQIFTNTLSATGALKKHKRRGQKRKSNFTKKGAATTPVSDYNLYSAYNVLDLIRNSPLNKKSLQKVPNQLRSLMFSDSDSTKNDWINQSSDPIKSPETAQMMRMNYDTFGKIEVFTGFKKDGKGNNIVLKPKFRMLNKKIIQNSESGVLLCRIEHYKNNLLGIGVNSGSDMQIFDNYFLMAKSDLLILTNKMKKISNRKGAMSSNKLIETVAKGGSDEEIAQVSAAMVEADISKIESSLKQPLLVEVPDTSTTKKPTFPKKKDKKNTIPQKPIDEVVTLDDTIGPPVSEEILEMLEVEEKQEMVASYSTSGNTHQDGDNGDFLGFTPPSPSDEKDDFNFDTPEASVPSVPTSAQAAPMAPMSTPGNTPTLPFGGNK
tara:strand:- start:14776 stop:18501 length:3726 start_codon:yes stop_codon:yes gene_type:complete